MLILQCKAIRFTLPSYTDVLVSVVTCLSHFISFFFSKSAKEAVTLIIAKVVSYLSVRSGSAVRYQSVSSYLFFMDENVTHGRLCSSEMAEDMLDP